MSEYTTDVTRTKGGYYCRILLQDKPLVQTKVSCRKRLDQHSEIYLEP